MDRPGRGKPESTVVETKSPALHHTTELRTEPHAAHSGLLNLEPMPNADAAAAQKPCGARRKIVRHFADDSAAGANEPTRAVLVLEPPDQRAFGRPTRDA